MENEIMYNINTGNFIHNILKIKRADKTPENINL